MQIMFQEIQYLKNKVLLFQFVFGLSKKHFVGYNLFGIQVFLHFSTFNAMSDLLEHASSHIPSLLEKLLGFALRIVDPLLCRRAYRRPPISFFERRYSRDYDNSQNQKIDMSFVFSLLFILMMQIVEQNGFLDAATVTALQNGHFDVASLTAADIPNPLAMQNQFNNCSPFWW